MTADAPVSAKKVSAIQAFIRAGFSLVPLCSPTVSHDHSGEACPDKMMGKVPTVNGWLKLAAGAYGVKELAGGNYGVVLPETTIVVDIDPRNFSPKGDKPMTRLCADLGLDPAALNTLIVQTGGKGLHYYFTIPAGVSVVKSLKKYPGIDIKSVGGQVVGPGSFKNNEYVILAGGPENLAECPAALLAFITRPVEAPLEENVALDAYARDEGAIARFSLYLTHEAPTSGSYKVACKGRDFGLAPDITLELMLTIWNSRRAVPRTPAEMKTRVSHAYKYATGALGGDHPAAVFDPLPVPVPLKDSDITWELTAQGVIKKSFVNLLNFMRIPGKGLVKVFGYNKFTDRVEFANPAPWHKGRLPAQKTVSDNDLKLLKGHLAVECAFEAAVGQIDEAVVIAAHENKFHPVQEYLSGLKHDGVARLDDWLRDYAGAPDDSYTQACARKTLCAAVLRAFKPGIKFDHVLVLEGEQGIGKSAICAILGGEWTGDFVIDPHDRDTVQAMQGKWIIELAELEVTRRADSDALKAFISRSIDTARFAYGRLANEFPRQSIFIATKNPGADGTYLKDDTGNRRWWPVALKPKNGTVDFRGLKDARNQLFAEAVARVQKGERLDMDTESLRTMAKSAATARHSEHEWTERISRWLDGLPGDRDFIAGRDIFLDAMGGLDKQYDRRSSLAIANVMRALGWKAGVQREGARTSRGYRKPDAVLADLI